MAQIDMESLNTELVALRAEREEEKKELIEVDSKYYDTEKESNQDLNNSRGKLKIEIEKVKTFINSGKNEEAIEALENCKIMIEEYANYFSKNENIKKESVKRNRKNSKDRSRN